VHSVMVLPSSGIILATVDDISCPRPPTSAPTPCSNGMDVEIQIKTDYYPRETSWSLTNKCTGTVINSPKYTKYVTMHSTSMLCLPAAQYEFTIKDIDGLCCQYGVGSYSVLVDGITVRSGGAFRSSEATTFGTACNAASEQSSIPTSNLPISFPITEIPTGYPTNSPSASPIQPPRTLNPTSMSLSSSHPPTVSLTFHPTSLFPTTLTPTNSPTVTPTPCSNGMNVEIMIKTDYYPKETSWSLTNKCGTGTIINSPKYTQHVTMQSTKLLCLPVGQYDFTIKDTDGICCGRYGDGSYSILVDGITVRSGGVFRNSETTIIGATCEGNSELVEPSPNPSTNPPTSKTPTSSPTSTPPSNLPTSYPSTLSPTSKSPTNSPTSTPPSKLPTSYPSSLSPTTRPPTDSPTASPSIHLANPTRIPTRNPTHAPTRKPARVPTRPPTRKPAPSK
jgi:hypothetical protein